jgi:hypothetical protein
LAAILEHVSVVISVALQHGIRAAALAKSIARIPENLEGPIAAHRRRRFPSGVVNQRLAVVVGVHAADDVGSKTSYGNQR